MDDSTPDIDARDGIHERDVHPDRLRDQIFHFSQHGQLILRLDVFRVSSVQTRYQTSERRYPDTLADTQDR